MEILAIYNIEGPNSITLEAFSERDRYNYRIISLPFIEKQILHLEKK